jgi:3-phytase
MNFKTVLFPYIFLALLVVSCNDAKVEITEDEVFPVVTTDTTPNDTDDPAIWYNAADPEKSLILGSLYLI